MKMKAACWTAYGPPEVLQINQVEKPVPKDNEVLIRVYASTVTAGDCEMRRFDVPRWIWLPLRAYMGIFTPRIKILGQELSGTVEAVGKNVTTFRAGDEVFAPTTMRLGAHAEYICLPADHPIALKPDHIPHEQAAALCTGGLNALHFLTKANLQHGQHVLINGAGGSIGTYAIQIAKTMGAEVTAVDITSKLTLLKSIGADHVIDYKREDFSKTKTKYDVVIDIIGKRTFSRCVRALTDQGLYIMGNPRLSGIIRGLWVSITTRKKVVATVAPYKQEEMEKLKTLIASGKVRPIIDRQFTIDQIVDAHRYVETGHKTGNLVITIP